MTSIGPEEGLLVLQMDCRNCSRGKGSLNDGTCFSAVVDAFADGMATDVIVLSGRNETRYSGPTVEMIAMVAEMRRGLGRLSIGVPGTKEGRDRAKSGVKDKDCDGCPAKTSTLFAGLSTGLAKGVGPYYGELRGAAARIEASLFEGPCRECAKAAMDDLHFLAIQYETLVRFVVKEGFSVVF